MSQSNKILQVIAVFFVNGIIGILYFKYSGINYNPAGVYGEPNTFNVTLSLIFIAVLLGAALVAGLFNLKGILWGLIFTPAFILILTIIGILGMGSIIAIFTLPFYYYIAPFTPVVEAVISIDKSNPVYNVNGQLMIFVPLLCYITSIGLYVLGRKIKKGKI